MWQLDSGEVLFCDSLVKLVPRYGGKMKLAFNSLDTHHDNTPKMGRKEMDSPVVKDDEFFDSNEQFLFKEKVPGQVFVVKNKAKLFKYSNANVDDYEIQQVEAHVNAMHSSYVPLYIRLFKKLTQNSVTRTAPCKSSRSSS